MVHATTSTFMRDFYALFDVLFQSAGTARACGGTARACGGTARACGGTAVPRFQLPFLVCFDLEAHGFSCVTLQ